MGIYKGDYKNEKRDKKRLVYLFTGEISAIIVFTLILFYYFENLSNRYSLTSVVLTLNVILLQGSYFWFVKWRRFETRKNSFPKLHYHLKLLKKIDLLLLLVAPMIVLIEILLLSESSLIELLTLLCIYIFAIIEYINYYFIQLTNYSNGSGKPSAIAKEIKLHKIE